jgi:hypothetical protein
MPELETRLRELAAEIAWPGTPDLEAAVAARLAGHQAMAANRGRAARWRGPVAAVVAALALIPAAGAVAFPGARHDVLRWLGLEHVRVERNATPPPVAARPELEDDLGAHVSRAEAVTRAGFEPLVPAALGEPDRVREVGRRISLLYAPRAGLPKLPRVDAGLIVTETRGRMEGSYLRKLLFAGSEVHRVRVNGRPGAFISGGSHGYIYVAPGGTVQEDRPLLTGPTLLWEQDGLVLRLEGQVGRATALRVARSFR